MEAYRGIEQGGMVVLSSATGRNERATLVGLGTLQHACVVVAKIPSTAVFPGISRSLF